MSFLFHLLSFDIAKILPVSPSFQTFFHKTPKTHQTKNGISDKRPNRLFFLSDFIKKKPFLLFHWLLNNMKPRVVKLELFIRHA